MWSDSLFLIIRAKIGGTRKYFEINIMCFKESLYRCNMRFRP